MKIRFIIISICFICLIALYGIIVYSVTNKIDTKIETLNKQIDSLEFVIYDYETLVDNLKQTPDSIQYYKDSMVFYKANKDSLYNELLVSNYKLMRIQEYCNIVKRDNTQLKYLRGWVNRVLED